MTRLLGRFAIWLFALVDQGTIHDVTKCPTCGKEIHR